MTARPSIALGAWMLARAPWGIRCEAASAIYVFMYIIFLYVSIVVYADGCLTICALFKNYYKVLMFVIIFLSNSLGYSCYLIYLTFAT